MSNCTCQKKIAGLRKELIHAHERLARLEEHSHQPQEIAPRVILELVGLGYFESADAAAVIMAEVARRRTAADLRDEIAVAPCCGEAAWAPARRLTEHADA